MRVMRVLAWSAGAVLLALAVIVLGGDGVWSLGGVHRLDIDGQAGRTGRPAFEQSGWDHYGGDAGGHRFSSLSQINRENVSSLRVAWRYSTGDMSRRPATALARMAVEGTPLLVDDRLVFCTPFNEVIALDPGTGAQLWRFDPAIDLAQRPANQFVCRGLGLWRDGEGAARLFMGTNDGRLIALDAATGAPASGFGAGGEVRIDPGMALDWPGEFQITSPPAVIGDVVVVGSAISDNARVAAPSGAVRAFDAGTGAPIWSFDPIPRKPGAPNVGDWGGDAAMPRQEGHANAWAPMSVDPARGLVFVPTSSPSPDYFGGLRPGDNRYANSVVALEAATGAVRWAFQTVHHDVWDYDLPSQPGLYSVVKDGAARDVVVQTTKTGLVFVLDRDTGEPVLPVEERPVPQGGVQGEALSPTQPMPRAPQPLVPSAVRPRDAWGLTLIDKLICRARIAALDNAGLFTPPSTRGALVRPFSGGGANWGGPAFDPGRNLVVVNLNNVGELIRLIPAEKIETARETFHDAEIAPQRGAPYGLQRELLRSPLGLPCTPPPWGVLAAVNLASGEIVWRQTFGTVEGLTGGVSKARLGVPNLGGPVITAGDLVFIGAAVDSYLRAFDVETGRELWRGRLPASPQATPMTYQWRGRQYVAIYAGGYARAGSAPGDALVAFALPDAR